MPSCVYCALCIIIVSRTGLQQKAIPLKRDVVPKELSFCHWCLFWRCSSLVPLLGKVLCELLKVCTWCCVWRKKDLSFVLAPPSLFIEPLSLLQGMWKLRSACSSWRTRGGTGGPMTSSPFSHRCCWSRNSMSRKWKRWQRWVIGAALIMCKSSTNVEVLAVNMKNLSLTEIQTLNQILNSYVFPFPTC